MRTRSRLRQRPLFEHSARTRRCECDRLGFLAGNAGGRAVKSKKLLQGDVCALPLASAAFDVVVCGLAVGHVENLRSVIAEAGRVLRAGGEFLYSDFHPFGALAGWRRTFRAEDGKEYAVRHFTHWFEDHVAACRAAGLEIVAVREPKIEITHKWKGSPAVLVIKALKKA